MTAASANRIAFFDNLKGLLILLVLVGHFFQDYPSFRWPIYAFHMPLFVFISGFFSKSIVSNGKYRAEKPLGIFFLYLGATTLSCWVQGRWIPVFLKPQWGLWYLQGLFVWYVLSPLADALRNRWVLLGAILLFPMLVREATVLDARPWMRILQYLPFFLMGRFAPLALQDFLCLGVVRAKKLIISSAVGGAILLLVLWAKSDTAAVVLGHYDMPLGFATPGDFAGWFARMFLLAPLISFFVMVLMPRCRLPLAFLGERTLQIYVFHAVFWPWEWQTREWFVPFVGGKAASFVSMGIWLGILLLPYWKNLVSVLPALASRILASYGSGKVPVVHKDAL